MIDEENDVGADRTDGELLLYDYFKYLTSLVIITLGGLLIVMKDFDPEDVKPSAVIITLIVVSLSGVVSFAGAGEIADARFNGRPIKKSVKTWKLIAPALLTVGFGHFLAMFIDSLN